MHLLIFYYSFFFNLCYSIFLLDLQNVSIVIDQKMDLYENFDSNLRSKELDICMHEVQLKISLLDI